MGVRSLTRWTMAAPPRPRRVVFPGLIGTAALLRAADEKSGAGGGHGYRTAMIARQIARRLVPDALDHELDDVEMAARGHEIGAVLEPGSTPTRQAQCGAALLAASGAAWGVGRLLQLMATDGGGTAPVDGRLGHFAVALRLANRLDHALADCRDEGVAFPDCLDRVLAEVAELPDAQGVIAPGLEHLLLLVLEMQASSPR
jgi:hypothetical protein